MLFTPQMMKNKEMAAQAVMGSSAERYLDLTLSFISSIISIVSIGYVLSAVSVWVFGVIVLMSVLKILTVVSDKRKSYNNSVDMASLNTKISYYLTMLMDENTQLT